MRTVIHAPTAPLAAPLAAWDVHECDFPQGGTPEQRLEFALRYAVLAPSTHNTQPWRFAISRETVALYADGARQLPVLDPAGRELRISCGAALFHLRIALRHFGYSAPEELLPDRRHPDLLARVALGDWHRPPREEEELFHAMLIRRTYRKPFDPIAMPNELMMAMQRDAALGGVRLAFVVDPRAKARLADLIAEADRAQLADKALRADLAAWMRDNRSTTSDGIPGYALGANEALALAEPLVMRGFDVGRMQAIHDAGLAAGSPALVALSTRGDQPLDWVAAGEVLARILLRAAASGVYASFLPQPVEVAALRPQVSQLLGTSDAPQLLLRMGFAHQVKATPRRAVADVRLD